MTLVPEGAFLAQCIFDTPSVAGPAMVVLGAQRPFGQDADECARVIAEDVWNATGSLLSVMTDDNVLTQVKAYLTGSGGVVTVGEWNGSLAGASTSAGHAPQVAILIQKLSGLAGRRNRGRMYVPGISETAVGSDGRLSSSALTSWQNAATAFFNAAVTADADLLILHETAPDTATPVTSLSVQATVATQRRRVR